MSSVGDSLAARGIEMSPVGDMLAAQPPIRVPATTSPVTSPVKSPVAPWSRAQRALPEGG